MARLLWIFCRNGNFFFHTILINLFRYFRARFDFFKLIEFLGPSFAYYILNYILENLLWFGKYSLFTTLSISRTATDALYLLLC